MGQAPAICAVLKNLTSVMIMIPDVTREHSAVRICWMVIYIWVQLAFFNSYARVSFCQVFLALSKDLTI